jgi:uncharacterized membrane protein
VSRDLQSLHNLLLSCATILVSPQLIPLPAITILICSSDVCLVLPTGLPPCAFASKTFRAIRSPPSLIHVLPILTVTLLFLYVVVALPDFF